MFRLQHTEHLELLKPIMLDILEDEPDMFIVTEDGDTVETHKMLLSLYSRDLASMLSDYPQGAGVPGISLPMKTPAVRNLISFLGEGTAFAAEKQILLEVARSGKALGMDFKNLHIGGKKEKNNEERKVTKALKNDDITDNPRRENVNEKGLKIKAEVEDKENALDDSINDDLDTSNNECDDSKVIHNDDDNSKVINNDGIMDFESAINSLIEKGDHLWYCKVCRKEYTPRNRSSLLAHVEKYHTSGFTHTCDSCDKTLATKDSLRSHKRSAHNPEVKENAVASKIIKNDDSKVLNEDDSKVLNDDDSKVLNNDDSNIIDDSKVVKNDGIMDFDSTINSMIEKVTNLWYCKVCRKEYTGKHKSNLLTHIERNHTSGFVHTCDSCDKTLASKESLRSHTRSVHKNSV
eukprot:GFUD01039556.1.p1 GENE.GFUD01039556.1~~GFUD01039556.1.p1  ORF type:complete len:406 (+),score=98.92 GFUD01039556.1:19-1236(+)